MVRHFGVFKFKNAVTEEQIVASFKSMKDMGGKIPGLLEMEHGSYNGNEGLNEDFTHGFLMAFDCSASRDAYLPYPLQEKVKNLVVPRLERVVVFDIHV